MNREWFKKALSVIVGLIAVYLLAVHVLERNGISTVITGRTVTAAQAAKLTREVRQMRALLADLYRRRAPPNASGTAGRNAPGANRLTVSLAGKPMLGDAAAPLTLVEFTDYQCPFCRRFHRDTLPRLKKEFIDTGKLRYVVADLPLVAIHPYAVRAAQAAHCAGEQGRYFAMNDKLFENASKITADFIPEIARLAGLEMERFGECYRAGRHGDRVRADAAAAARLGITGTPSFVLGPSQGALSLTGGKIVGARPYASFKAAIDQLLAAAK